MRFHPHILIQASFTRGGSFDSRSYTSTPSPQVIGGPPLNLPAPFYQALIVCVGLFGGLIVPPPSCRQSAMYPRKYTRPITALWGAACEWPGASLQTTITPRFLQMGNSGVTDGATLGSRSVLTGHQSEVTLEPYNGRSCASGPVWIHSEKYNGMFLEDKPSGTTPLSLGIECVTSSHTTSRIFGLVGSAWSCLPVLRLAWT